LYAAAAVAADADSAAFYYRRVSIEYSRSEWADDALLRLAQLAYASGQLRAAIRSADRILLDYPFSDVEAQAAFWAGLSRLELDERDEGCRLLAQAQETSGENVELNNRVRYLLQRCDTGAAADSAAQPQTPRSRTTYAVQVAAVGTAAAADVVMQSLFREGYQPRVVRDADGLLKVRVGEFASRSDAQALAAELRRKIGGQPFVVEER
jgi:hypothetical protein